MIQIQPLITETTRWLSNRAQSDLLTNADALIPAALDQIEASAPYKPCLACPPCFKWSQGITSGTAGVLIDSIVATATSGETSGRYDFCCEEWGLNFVQTLRYVAENLEAADKYNGDGAGSRLAEQYRSIADGVANSQDIAENVTSGGLLNPENAPEWLKWAVGLIAANELLKWWEGIRR